MRRQLVFAIIITFAAMSLAQQAAAQKFFPHDEHLKQHIIKITCKTCHKPGASSIVPDKKVCLQCHAEGFPEKVSFVATRTHGPAWPLNHRNEAKANVPDCSSCHQQQFCLRCHQVGPANELGSFGSAMVNVHYGDFMITHPIMARTNPQLCSSCHEAKFCSDCHSDFRRDQLAGVSHRRTWSTRKIGVVNHEQISTKDCQKCHVNSVLPTHEWAPGHAREARKNLATCQVCHPQGQVCLTCHSARSGLGINPHPADWGDRKDRLRDASGGETCRKCH
jgi:hypothetical protein